MKSRTTSHRNPRSPSGSRFRVILHTASDSALAVIGRLTRKIFACRQPNFDFLRLLRNLGVLSAKLDEQADVIVIVAVCWNDYMHDLNVFTLATIT